MAVVDITMINPPIVPESWDESVVVSVACDRDQAQPLRIAARQHGAILASADIAAQGGEFTICVSSAALGPVDIRIETVDGEQMSDSRLLLVAPEVVAQEMSALFYVAMGEYQDATGGNLERAELVSRTWSHCFQPMIAHVGHVLMYPDDKSEGAYDLVTKLLEYFILNGAYQTGQFILKVAGDAGRQITMNGQCIDMKNVDLASLHRNAVVQQ